MEAAVECTHCRVVMTSWSAPGSPIRYYQCPFCSRTHSSPYGEVFRRHAGARIVDAPAARAPASGIPMASAEEMRWAKVKQTAARWFARIEADEQRCAPHAPVARVAPRKVAGARPALARAAPARVRAGRAVPDELPEIDPDDVVEISAPPRRLRRS